MHADFLAAIRDEPDNLDHRLIYADWLEDHATNDLDRARAELIRVQIAREAGNPDEDDFWLLRARERWLLARWNKGLTGDLRHRVRRYRFRRGLVEWIEADHRQLDLPTLPDLAPIRGLRPVGSGYFNLRPWRQITTLDLSKLRHPARNYVSSVLQELPALRELDLGPGQPPELDMLTPPEAIRSLALNASRIADLRLSPLLPMEWLERLESLTLRGPREGQSRSLLWQLSRCPAAANLRELRFENQVFHTLVGPTGPYLRNLRVLEVRACGILWATDIANLTAFPLPELRVLSLVGCGLPDDAVRMLVRNPDWPRLHTLELLPPTGLHSRSLEALTAGPILPRLRRLALSRVDPDALRLLARGSSPLTTSEERDLGQGPENLAELCAEMDFGSNAILTGLATSRYLDKLTTLEIPGWSDFDADHYHPFFFRRLSWLDLRGRGLSASAITRLRQLYGPGFRHGAYPAREEPTPTLAADDIPF